MDCAYSVEPRDRPSHKIETHGVRFGLRLRDDRDVRPVKLNA